MYALYICQPCLMSCHLSDVCAILLWALSHVMSSFWCMHYTFVSLVSCHVIFLMYALYFCQPCLMSWHLSNVYTILLSALSHVMSSFWCMHCTFVSLVSCHVIILMYALYFVSLVSFHGISLMYALYFCQPCLMLCHLSDVCTRLL